MNAEIARLEAKFRSRSFAEVDFSYDHQSNALAMVPFEEDFAELDGEAARKRLADGLSDLRDACMDLARDIQLDKKQVPGTLRRQLTRFAREAQLGPDKIRSGTLRRLGASLIRFGADDDIRHGLDYLAPALDDITRQHLSLQAAFHGGMLARMAPLAEATLDATPEEADSRIGSALDAINSDAWRDLPRVPEEFAEMVESQRDALREMASRVDLKPEGEERQRMIRAVEEGYISLGATVTRLIVRAIEATQQALSRPVVAVPVTLIGIAGSLISIISFL